MTTTRELPANSEKRGECWHYPMSPWSYEKIVEESYELLIVGLPARTMAFPRKVETIIAVRHCKACGWIQRGAQS